MAFDLFLVRHGETVWNREKRFQGSMDSPLTDLGRAQADRVGAALARLPGIPPAVPVLTSPLPRAVETAAIVRSHLPGAVPVVLPALREVALGDWEGLSRAEVKARWGAALAAVPRPEWYFEAPGGEGYEAARARAAQILAGLSGPAVVVSHSVLGRLLRGVHGGLTRAETALLPAPQDAIWHLSATGITLLPA